MFHKSRQKRVPLNLHSPQDKQNYVDVNTDNDMCCPYCGKVQMKGDVPTTGIEIKCRSCKKLIRFQKLI